MDACWILERPWQIPGSVMSREPGACTGTRESGRWMEWKKPESALPSPEGGELLGMQMQTAMKTCSAGEKTGRSSSRKNLQKACYKDIPASSSLPTSFPQLPFPLKHTHHPVPESTFYLRPDRCISQKQVKKKKKVSKDLRLGHVQFILSH